MTPRVISLVEDGWESARALSLAIAREPGWPVCHYVKGRVPREVLGLIALQPGERIVPVARSWFRSVLACVLARAALSPKALILVVDNDRTHRWASSWSGRARIVCARERLRRLTYEYGGKPFSAEALVQQWRRA